jgi:divalent metal cation (Fe/Co/Zn/Cd) transporter
LDTFEKVQQTLSTFEEIKHFHSVKIRTAGADTFIKFNIHLDPDLSLLQAHELCDKIENKLNSIIPRSEIYIHAEPQVLSHLQTEENDN